MYNENNPIFRQPIEAILPAYDNHGDNICHIISTRGTSTTVAMNGRKFMRLWFYFLRMDLTAQGMWSHHILGQRNLNPIVVNEHLVLIPVKIRQAIGSKDGCYGYIRVSSIQSISPGEIVLSSGFKVSHLSSIETIKTKIRHAHLLKYIYKDEFQIQHKIYSNSQWHFDEGEDTDKDKDKGQ